MKTQQTEMEDFIDRNGNYTSSLLKEVLEVEINPYVNSTFSEAAELQARKPLVVSKTLSELSLTPFRLYGEIFQKYADLISLNEKRSDLMFKKGENIDDWLLRVKKIKGGDLWINMHWGIFSLIKDVHDGKILEQRKAHALKGEELQKSEQLKKEFFLNEFIKENQKYIDRFCEQTSMEEGTPNSLGLTDKTVFKNKIDDFIEQLAKSSGVSSVPEIKGAYKGFKEDLKDYISSDFTKKNQGT